MNQNKYQNAAAENVFLSMIGCIALMALFVWGLGYAIDDHFTRQDIMLCQSAQVSGNEAMLDRCSTYYKTNNPADIKEAK